MNIIGGGRGHFDDDHDPDEIRSGGAFYSDVFRRDGHRHPLLGSQKRYQHHLTSFTWRITYKYLSI